MLDAKHVRVEMNDKTFEHPSLEEAIAHAKALSEGKRGPVVVVDPEQRLELRYQYGALTGMEVRKR